MRVLDDHLEASIEDVIQFIRDNDDGISKKLTDETLKNLILIHISFNTCIIDFDRNGFKAFCRWNAFGDTAIIHGLIIRKNVRNKREIKKLLLRGLGMYPYVKYLQWRRVDKYPNRGYRTYSIKTLLRRKK